MGKMTLNNINDAFDNLDDLYAEEYGDISFPDYEEPDIPDISDDFEVPDTVPISIDEKKSNKTSKNTRKVSSTLSERSDFTDNVVDELILDKQDKQDEKIKEECNNEKEITKEEEIVKTEDQIELSKGNTEVLSEEIKDSEEPLEDFSDFLSFQTEILSDEASDNEGEKSDDVKNKESSAYNYDSEKNTCDTTTILSDDEETVEIEESMDEYEEPSNILHTEPYIEPEEIIEDEPSAFHLRIGTKIVAFVAMIIVFISVSLFFSSFVNHPKKDTESTISTPVLLSNEEEQEKSVYEEAEERAYKALEENNNSTRFETLDDLTLYLDANISATLSNEKTLVYKYENGAIDKEEYLRKANEYVSFTDELNHLLVANKNNYTRESKENTYDKLNSSLDSLMVYGDTLAR